MPATTKDGRRTVRYAVVGLGYIAQAAVLPAFIHARKNSRLAAFVSDDPAKLDRLGAKCRVDALYRYDQYDECLRSGLVDAVYIARPTTAQAIARPPVRKPDLMHASSPEGD